MFITVPPCPLSQTPFLHPFLMSTLFLSFLNHLTDNLATKILSVKHVFSETRPLVSYFHFSRIHRTFYQKLAQFSSTTDNRFIDISSHLLWGAFCGAHCVQWLCLCILRSIGARLALHHTISAVTNHSTQANTRDTQHLLVALNIHAVSSVTSILKRNQRIFLYTSDQFSRHILFPFVITVISFHFYTKQTRKIPVPFFKHFDLHSQYSYINISHL